MKIKYYRLNKHINGYYVMGQIFAVYDNDTYHRLSSSTEGYNKSLRRFRYLLHEVGGKNLEEIENLDKLIPLIPHMHKQFIEKYKQSL